MKFSRLNMIIQIAILFIVALPLSVYAAPSVTSTSGTISHGQSITVNGSGFGTKSPVAPQQWDPNSDVSQWFKSGDVGSAGIATTAATTRGKYTTHFTNATKVSGTGNAVVGANNYTAGNYFYVTWWVYPSATGYMTDPAYANKWTRFTSNGQWSSATADLQWTPTQNTIINLQNTNIATINYSSIVPSRSTWTRFESIVNNTANPHPASQMLLNNSSVASFSAPSTIAPVTGIFTLGADFDDNGNGQGNNARIDFGEIYVDNTLSRVEICNASTKSGSNHCEIQIPQTTWTDGQLQIKVNQGSFPDNSTAYLYVLDSSGTANSTGYAVTFGSSGGSSDTTPPTANISSPVTGSTVSGNVSVNVSASDNVGVTKVELYVDGALSSTDTTSPYTFTWNTATASNGTHTLSAKAYDSANNGTTSASISVTVNNSIVDTTTPTIAVTSPTGGGTVSGNIAVTASASDNVGVSKVEFYMDSATTPLATLTSSPYTFNWDTTSFTNGIHTINAKAYDAASNIGQSATVSITVNNTSPIIAGSVTRNECSNPPAGTIFCEDFEGTNPKSNFNDYDGNLDTENLIVTDRGPSGDSSNKEIRLRVPAGQSGVSDLLKVLPGSYDKLYARWYFQYEPGFNFSAPNHGGGLAAGDRSYVGQSGARPTGADFAGFYVQYNQGTPFTAAPYSYSYYRGMYQECTDPNGSCWGDALPCVYDNGASYCTKSQDRPTVTLPTLTAGQWYCYEQMVDLGTASSTGTGATGRLTQWLDGNLIADNTNLWLRTTSNLKLQNLWLSLYHHDGTHSTVGELIDNVVVSTQRIGCGSAVPPPVPANAMPITISPN